MAIRFKYGSVLLTADTPQEAAQTIVLLKERDEKAARDRAMSRVLAKLGGPMDQLQRYVAEEAQSPWTPEIFLSFIERLGESQQAAVAALVMRHRVTDEELRKAVGVSGNQALAGVLSGISKQAAALNIPAREVFSFENLRRAGRRRSTYMVAEKFLQIAHEMNWPTPQSSAKQ